MSKLNLIAADLKRIRKDKAIGIVLIIIAGLYLLVAIIFKSLVSSDVENEPMIKIMNSAFAVTAFLLNLDSGNLGFYFIIVASIFLGSDYSFNTIRNKLVGGNSRVKVYLSSFVTSVLIFFILFLFTCLIGFLINVTLFGYVMSNGYLIKAMLLCILPYMAIAAIATFVSMVSKTRTLGITVNVLIALFLPSIFQILSLLPGAGQAISEYLPYSIISELMNTKYFMMNESVVPSLYSPLELTLSLILRSLLVPLAYIGVFTGAGLLIFKKMDIK